MSKFFRDMKWAFCLDCANNFTDETVEERCIFEMDKQFHKTLRTCEGIDGDGPYSKMELKDGVQFGPALHFKSSK